MTGTLTAAAPSHTADTSRHHQPGVGAVLGVELRKLAAQARGRYSILGCIVAPPLLVLAVKAQSSPPTDTLYGRHIHVSGYATPLLLLTFAHQWLFPVLTAVVAGDIFASEDHHGTWKTVLTRSVGRTRLFAAKTIAAVVFSITTLVLLATSTIISSILLIGSKPLPGLSGQTIGSSTARRLVALSWLSVIPPIIGFTALGVLVSIWTRSPSAGIVVPLVLGLVMGFASALTNIDPLRHVLLTTPFEAWHNLLITNRSYDLIIHGAIVCAAWTAIALTAAFTVFRRRNITGG